MKQYCYNNCSVLCVKNTATILLQKISTFICVFIQRIRGTALIFIKPFVSRMTDNGIWYVMFFCYEYHIGQSGKKVKRFAMMWLRSCYITEQFKTVRWTVLNLRATALSKSFLQRKKWLWSAAEKTVASAMPTTLAKQVWHHLLCSSVPLSCFSEASAEATAVSLS